jgi:hypothetical protein
MSFLHFEAHKCCMDILFYNFCTNFIKILWYCKFVIGMMYLKCGGGILFMKENKDTFAKGK